MGERVANTETSSQRLVEALRDEFRRAYSQEADTTRSPLGSSGRTDKFYRVVNLPLHDRQFTNGSVVIVRKAPHPDDDPYNFTEIYAPIKPTELRRSWQKNPPGTQNDIFYMHIRRVKAGAQSDRWIMIDEQQAVELDDNPFEPIPLINDHDPQRCASKLLDLMRRESLISVTATEVAHTNN